MATVLVTDGQQRKALATVRSLHRAGYRVHVAEDMALATALFSRYAVARAVYPSPGDRPEAFAAWLDGYVRRQGIDVVLPMDDATVAASLQVDLPCRSLLPTAAAFARFRDKAQTLELAGRIGIPAPRWAIAPEEPARAAQVASEIGFPLVIKPRVSSGGRGLALVRQPEAFAAALRAARAHHSGLLLQSWVGQGRQIDVGLLLDGGAVIARFAQEELRHYPPVGGPSTLQESVDCPVLVERAQRLLCAAGWRGPAEVEFRRDAAGEFQLMEVNPRFWASLALGIQAGVDFPRLAVEVALGGDPRGPERWALGLRCRWLLPGDILVYLSRRRPRMDPPFWRTYDGRTFDDIVDVRDPGPILGFALASAAYLLRRRWREMVLRRGAEW